MSEGKQLTVAELLARAEKTGSGQSRPRRRRSLEDGGVSVAELTGSLKKVDARPVESKHSSVPIDAPAETPESKPAPKQSVSRPISASKPVASTTPTPKQTPAQKPAQAQAPKQEAKPEPKPAPKPVQKPAPKADSAGVSRKISAPADTGAKDDTAVIGRVDAEPPVRRTGSSKVSTKVDEPHGERREARGRLDEFGDYRSDKAERPAALDERDVAQEDEGTLNPILLVLLVFAGLVLGVLGFLAFQWVWTSLPTIAAVLLALAAVAAVVFGVRVLRTGRDGLTMTMAAVAAAVMAFGPALIV